MAAIDQLLEEYINNLRKQNEILNEINRIIIKQQEYVKKEQWDILMDYLKKTDKLMEERKKLAKESKEKINAAVNLLGLESFNRDFIEKIPEQYVSCILTEINKMRINLEKGNQLTLDNEFFLKDIIRENEKIINYIKGSN